MLHICLSVYTETTFRSANIHINVLTLILRCGNKRFKNMKNTSKNNEDYLLEQLNDAKALLMLPVMLFLTILMLIGLIGNLMVCYYYGCKARQTSNTVFVVTVAVFDLILCSLSVPFELLDMRYFYMFTYSGICKVMRFVNYFAVTGSAFTLLVISGDRYRKICQPFKKQFGPQEAKISILSSVIVALMFSWEAFLFYDSVSVDIHVGNGTSITGYDCTTTRELSYKTFLSIFNAVSLAAFLVSTVSLSVLYVLVLYTLHKAKTFRKLQACTRYGTNDSDTTTTTQQTQLSSSTPEPQRNCYFTDSAGKRGVSFNAKTDSIKMIGADASDKMSEKGKHVRKVDITTIKFTMMMLVISVIFILSFLPHLSLALWRVFLHKYESESMSDVELVFFNIGLRSYFLNSAINPFIYGFFNAKFRLFFKTRLLCVSKTSRRSVKISSTPPAS